ncbi:MAG: hypothetical protein ACXWF8_00530 [Methylobacter sp.]
MKKFALASMILIGMPVAGIAADQQGAEVPAVPRIDQSRPRSTLSSNEQIAAKHLAAAAAHEQAEMHHKAAAEAAQKNQMADHAKAAGKASAVACEKSAEAVSASPQ